MANTNNTISEAAYAKFVSEIYQVQNGVYNARVENAANGDTESIINAHFTKVKLKNAPAEFESFDEGEEKTGYAIDLDYIKYTNADFGKKYSADKVELTFDKDDVYVYDATGAVYYVRGVYYEENDEVVYSISNIATAGMKSTEDGPIITGITVSSGELADGTKTNAKAKITVTALARNGGEITVTVRNNIAEKQPDGTFVTQVSRNGTYTVLVTEENGGRTVGQAVVTGILESTLPPTNLSIMINGGAAYTDSNNVTVTVTADGATKMLISRSPIRPTADADGWEDFRSSFDYDLGTNEGKVTLYAWFMDEFGNITDQITKASITYDKTGPSNNAPTVTNKGPYAIVTCNQHDGVTADRDLEISYGYKVKGSTSDYVWSDSSLIGPLENGVEYEFVTKAKDESGNETPSAPTQYTVKYDYVINYDLQGGSGDEAIFHTTGTVNGGSITLPAQKPERAGYDFIGWSENKDADPASTSEIIVAGGNYRPTGTVINKTLYAIWKAQTDIPYTVKHYVERPGTLGDYELKFTENLTGTTDQAAYAIVKTDGEFAHFKENIEHRNRLVMDFIRADGSTELRVYYTRNRYTLTLNATHGTVKPEEAQVSYGETVTITATPSDGYAFEKWLKGGSAAGTANDTSATTTFTMPGNDVTLTATFKAVTYQITYDLKYGTVTPANRTTYTRETSAFTLTNPTKTGYTFAGWTGTDLKARTIEVTINPATIVTMTDREYEAWYLPTVDLLTMSLDRTTSTSGEVNVSINCLDTRLTLQYKIGEEGTWTNYTRGSKVPVTTNCTVYSRALEGIEVVDEESIVIRNIDKEKPVIKGTEIASTWTAGNTLSIKITAEDNVGVYAYAITNSSAVPSASSFVKASECKGILPCAVSGINYVWVIDEAGNTTSKQIKAWDISKNGDKKVYAFIPDETEMMISGTGETKAYTETNVPYRTYKNDITKITINEGVTSLNNHILSRFENAKEISLPKTLATITDDAMIYTNNFDKLTVATDNANFVASDLTLFSKNKDTIYIHSKADTKPSYTIPSTVKDIKKLAFVNNGNLQKITTTSNPNLGISAFEGCVRLEQIDGSIGGTKISERAFYGCTALEKIVLSDTLTTIGDRAFYDTRKIADMIMPKSLTIVGTSAKEVFKNIGINAGTETGKGVVRYYASSSAMRNYATTYATEATFVMIDDIGPELTSVSVTSPATGIYPSGTEITIVATYNEALSAANATLTVKFGSGSNRVITAGVVNGNEVTYKYTATPEDQGRLTFVSYTGTATDLFGNVSNISSASMIGNDITINSVVKLEEGINTWYFTTLQAAIDAAKVNPEVASKITLLTNLVESTNVPANKNIALNMNGKTISGESGKAVIDNTNAILTIEGIGKLYSPNNKVIANSGSNGIVNIINVAIESESTTVAAVTNINAKNMTIKDSTVKNKYIAVENNTELTIKNSEITSMLDNALYCSQGKISIEGGIIETQTDTEAYAIKLDTGTSIMIDGVEIKSAKFGIRNNGIMEIKGGTKMNTIRLIDNYGTVRIYDGEYTGGSIGYSLIDNYNGTLEIYGGTFSINYQRSVIINRANTTINGGTFTGTNEAFPVIYNYTAGSELTINGGEFTGLKVIENVGTMIINKDVTISSTGDYAVINNENASCVIGATTITSTGTGAISNAGTASLNGTQLKVTGTYGINHSGTGNLTIENADIQVKGTNSAESVAVQMTSSGMLYMTGTNIAINANAGNAMGIKMNNDNAKVNIADGTITANATAGLGIGINNNKGQVTLGADDASINDNLIKIEGSETGYYASANGKLAFYDGSIIGQEGKSLVGSVDAKPESTYVKKTIQSGKEISTLAVDLEGPTATLTASTEEWTSSDVTLTGTATDSGSGIVAYAFNSSPEFVVDGEWITVERTNRIEVTETATFMRTYYFHVKDWLGNESVSNKVDVKIDKIAPTITGVNVNTSSWINGNVEITVSATDNLSGITKYEFTKTYHGINEVGNYTDIAPTLTFERVIPTENAHWYIYLKDAAGNTAYQHINIRNVDNVAPTIEVSANFYSDTSTTIKISATDYESGINKIIVNGAEIDFTVSGTRNNTWDAMYRISEAGVYTIKAIDKAGNETEKVINAYLLSYVPNGGMGENINRIKIEDIAIDILENAFVKIGYEFKNWNTKIDGTGVTYQAGQTFTENSSTVFYAMWKDITAPQILDIVLSPNHVSGSNPLIRIVATDNEKVVGYAITTTPSTPTSWSNSQDVSISNGDGTYYVWVKDEDGNITMTEFKIYDVSTTTSPKSVFALEKKNPDDDRMKLSIEGNGKTRDFTKDTLPWKNDLDGISNIQVKHGVTGLGSQIFGHLEDVDTIIIADTVTSIEKDTFIHSTNFERIVVEGDYFVYEDGMLLDAGKETLYIVTAKNTPEIIVIPNTVTEIAPYAMEKTTMKQVVMPNNIDIPDGAFKDAALLEKVSGPIEGVGGERIGTSAFEGCINLKEVKISEDIKKLGDRAFYNTEKLIEITIPKTIEELEGKEVFTNTSADVYYYLSCGPMVEYAENDLLTKNQAHFIPIDDIPPTTDAPTLRASSSTIVVTAHQTDLHSAIAKVEYMIRKDGEDYVAGSWQTDNYFLGLIAETKYYVKTRTTDAAGNVSESEETSITTKKIPDHIEMTYIPSGTTSGDVTVIIEWPEVEISSVYGGSWPAGSDVTKQVGIRGISDASITWHNADRGEAVTRIQVTENETTVYAKLTDGYNTTNATLLKVDTIDRIAPTGSITINDGDERTLDTQVVLNLKAQDNRPEPQYGVQYYFASEDPDTPVGDPGVADWKIWNGDGDYDFTLSDNAEVKTVYVWFMDYAGNVSLAYSADIELYNNAVRLDQDGLTTYYPTLTAGIDAVNKTSPETPSRLTILRTILDENPLAIASEQNTIIDLNGFNISITTDGEVEGFYNNGKLKFVNSVSSKTSNINVVTSNGDAYGIVNNGLLFVDTVSVNATTASGTAIGIHNKRNSYAVMLQEGSTTTYYRSLQSAFDVARKDNPATASKVTLLRNITEETDLLVESTQNIILEMAGHIISAKGVNETKLLQNNGKLRIQNTSASDAKMTVATTNGTAYGIYNTKYVEINNVEVEATSTNGQGVAVHNERQEYVASTQSGSETDYYVSLQEAINMIPANNSATATTITLLQEITAESDITISAGQNVKIDLNGYPIRVTSRGMASAFINNGTLELTNSSEDAVEVSTVTRSGNAYGVYNTGHLEVGNVKITAEARNGIGYGIYNVNE